MNNRFVTRFLGLATLTLACSAGAAPVLYTGSVGTLSASARFDIVGGKLQIVLTNTSSADALVPIDILTALFFNITGNPLLTRDSVVSNGTTFLNGASVSPSGTVVGGEYGYVNSLAQYGANEGVSNSGLGLFGPPDLFPGDNLEGPASPDGIQYGLTSAGDNVSTGNSALMSNSLTKNAVTITLGGLPVGFTLANISNVTFQYGTSLSEGHFGGTVFFPFAIPEPDTVALLAFGFLAVGLARRRARSDRR